MVDNLIKSLKEFEFSNRDSADSGKKEILGEIYKANVQGLNGRRTMIVNGSITEVTQYINALEICLRDYNFLGSNF